MAATREELRILAEAYLHSPDASSDPRLRQMVQAEVARINRAFDALKKKIDIVFTPDDPYRSYEEMYQRVLSERRMLVFTGFSDTPLWSPETNWKARAVHDWDHIVHQVDFSMEGEAAAARISSARMPGLSPLYLSEIALQAAVQNYTGEFAAQKVVLPSDDRVARVANSLRGMREGRAQQPAVMVWNVAGWLKFMRPEEAVMHLKARGYNRTATVEIVYAAMMLHRRRR